MPISTIGDMAQHFQSLRSTGGIKTQLAKLSLEMSSGQVADIGQHLNGKTSEFEGLNHEIALLNEFETTNKETQRTLAAMQLALAKVDNLRNNSSGTFLLVTADSQQPQVDGATVAGRSAFIDTINTLNGSSAGRAMFSGTDVDARSLADPETMLSDIVAAVGVATTKDDIISVIDNWFDATGGGFETAGYLGNQESQFRATDHENSIEIVARADDPAIRDLLKGLAYSAVAGENAATLSVRTQASLVASSGVKLIESAQGLSHLQGALGESEASIALAEASNSSMQTSYAIARGDMVMADPFETATKLQDIQTQLETHFAVTARLSRLNLVDFLR